MTPLFDALTRRWWVFALRGILAVLFGIGCLLWPGIALLSLIFLFGAYAVIDGIFLAVAGFERRSWLTIIEGVISFIAGIMAFVWPGITSLVLLYIIAFYALFTGVMEIVSAIQLRRVISNEWFHVIQGILSILFGLILLTLPRAGALAIVWLIGIYGIIFGIITFILALRLHSARV